MDFQINQEKAIDFILGSLYESEFEVIDGVNQHRDGYNYADWLFRKNLITKEERERVQAIWDAQEKEENNDEF